METKTIFDNVRAEKFGRLWLINDGSVRYWTTQAAMDIVDSPEYADESEGYSRWCSDTDARGYRDQSGIVDTLPADLSAEARDWERKIEARGFGYRALVA